MMTPPVSQTIPPEHLICWMREDVPVADLGVVGVLLPRLVFPELAPIWLRKGIATHSAALTAWNCSVCGGRRWKRSRKTRAQHSANPRAALWQPYVRHTPECPAVDARVVDLLRSTRPVIRLDGERSRG